MRAVIVSGLALVASVVTPAFAEELVGPPAPTVEAVAEPEVVAEPEKPAGKPLELRPNRGSDGGGAGGFGIGMKLAAVAAVFGGAFLLFKRKNGGFASPRSNGVGPRIVSRTAVGMRNELLVVEVEGQRLLIGVTPSAMSTLSVLVDEPKELLEEPSKVAGYQLQNYRPAIPPSAPLPTSAVEESLSRLIASARSELDDANFIRKTPMPRVTQLRAQRTKTDKVEKADKPEKADGGDKVEPMPTARKARGALREVTSLEPSAQRGLEGQVRGLTAKRG